MSDEQDFETIKYMLQHAIQHGVEVEVVFAFANLIRDGQRDFRTAANEAMHEWDI